MAKKKIKRHFNNREEVLMGMREVRKAQNRADKAVAASWSAFMIMGLLTLYKDLGFRDKRIAKSIEGMHRINEEFDKGFLTLDEMKRELYDSAGVIVEEPK